MSFGPTLARGRFALALFAWGNSYWCLITWLTTHLAHTNLALYYTGGLDWDPIYNAVSSLRRPTVESRRNCLSLTLLTTVYNWRCCFISRVSSFRAIFYSTWFGIFIKSNIWSLLLLQESSYGESVFEGAATLERVRFGILLICLESNGIYTIITIRTFQDTLFAGSVTFVLGLDQRRQFISLLYRIFDNNFWIRF